MTWPFMNWLFDTLRSYPEIAIFLALALGFFIGGVKFGKFSLGNVTGVLLAGVLIGQLNITISPNVKSVFFLMFLFAVGYSVGPQFFRGLKSDGLPQVFFADHFVRHLPARRRSSRPNSPVTTSARPPACSRAPARFRPCSAWRRIPWARSASPPSNTRRWWTPCRWLTPSPTCSARPARRGSSHPSARNSCG